MGSLSAVAEVVHLDPPQTFRAQVRLEAGDRLLDVVRRSGLAERFPDLDWAAAPVGVYGRLRQWSDAAVQGDRIEIYRMLTADPKASRRQRAAVRARKATSAKRRARN